MRTAGRQGCLENEDGKDRNGSRETLLERLSFVWDEKGPVKTHAHLKLVANDHGSRDQGLCPEGPWSDGAHEQEVKGP